MSNSLVTFYMFIVCIYIYAYIYICIYMSIYLYISGDQPTSNWGTRLPAFVDSWSSPANLTVRSPRGSHGHMVHPSSLGWFHWYSVISPPQKKMIPSGYDYSYWKWPFIVDFPIKNGGSFHSYVSLPEGIWWGPLMGQNVQEILRDEGLVKGKLALHLVFGH